MDTEWILSTEYISYRVQRIESLCISVKYGLGDHVNVSREPGAAPKKKMTPVVNEKVDFTPKPIELSMAKSLLYELIEGYAEPDVQRNIREVIYLAGDDLGARRNGLAKVVYIQKMYQLLLYGMNTAC